MTQNISPLPDIMLEPLVRAALLEDLGRAGDITADSTIPAHLTWRGKLVARQHGVVAGMDMARLAFHLLDPKITFEALAHDGDVVAPQTILAVIHGNARAILSGERVALNFLCHMSGIATATHALVEAVKPHHAHVVCTRKTTPNLRIIEKYAVRAGGGFNHRFGLDDAILIKDNHIAAAKGITAAVTHARASAGHLVKIEVEIDTLDQLREALTLPIDAVLLDNMDTTTLQEAVRMVNGKCITEASGRINATTINAVAATGVDVISAGYVTHSAPILDIGLDEA